MRYSRRLVTMEKVREAVRYEDKHTRYLRKGKELCVLGTVDARHDS